MWGKPALPDQILKKCGALLNSALSERCFKNLDKRMKWRSCMSDLVYDDGQLQSNCIVKSQFQQFKAEEATFEQIGHLQR